MEERRTVTPVDYPELPAIKASYMPSDEYYFLNSNCKLTAFSA
jgi:hypothetical protein